MAMEGKIASHGYYEGKRVVLVEYRSTFRATDTWEHLGAVPKEALDWDIHNESTANSMDVNYQKIPDPRAPSYQTLESGGGSLSDLDPGDWRPQYVNIRGTMDQGYYFYYVIENQYYDGEQDTYLEATRDDIT